jgi:hypothetical protein
VAIHVAHVTVLAVLAAHYSSHVVVAVLTHVFWVTWH